MVIRFNNQFHRGNLQFPRTTNIIINNNDSPHCCGYNGGCGNNFGISNGLATWFGLSQSGLFQGVSNFGLGMASLFTRRSESPQKAPAPKDGNDVDTKKQKAYLDSLAKAKGLTVLELNGKFTVINDKGDAIENCDLTDFASASSAILGFNKGDSST